MRAVDQQRYHDILRREARPQARKLCRGSAPVAAQLSGSSHGTQPSLASRSGASLVCDPLAELNIPSTAVPEVLEYVCDRRGFTSLHTNFLRFEYLRCIVLEHNAFETLHNLLLPPSALRASSPASTITAADGLPLLPPPPPLYRGCRQLTHLHAAYNRIRDIAGDTDIPRLFLLEHLSLAYNQLTGLGKVLDALKRLRNLRFLDLRGNPLTGESRYRERCIAALPQVEVLDRQSVTPKEREEAAAPTRWNGRTHESRSHSAATSADTAVSSTRPRTSPSCTTRLRAAGDPFAKSLTAKDLERVYAAYLRQQRQAQEAASQSTASVWRQQEETWESFHAVWTLSQPGMPLSADDWQRTQMAAAAAASESAEGNVERPETQSSFLVSTPNFRVSGSSSASPSAPSSPLHAGRKPIKTPSVPPATTTITAATAATQVNVGSGTAALNVIIEVSFDRPLFPSSAETAGTPESATSQLAAAAASTRSGPLPSAATANSLLPSIHDSLYFRTVRGGSATSCKGMAPLLPAAASPPAVSRLLPVKGLAPDRLTTLQRTLQASAQVVRVVTARQSSLGTLKKLSAVQERVGSGQRNVAPSPPPSTVAAATSIPVEYSTLRTIQETKYAVIPPPWEDATVRVAVGGAMETVAKSPRAVVASPAATGASEASPNCIGVVSPSTTQQEALTEILVLLHDVYSLKELQALESEYGGAELLRLLPLREWSAVGSESGPGEVVCTAVAARQAMTLLSHSDNVGSPAGGGGGNVRGSASQHDRKCVAASKGTAHRGNTRPASVATRGGGGADTAAGGVPTAAAVLDAARAALRSEPQLVWQLLTGPYMVAGATAGGSPGVLVALGKSIEDASGSVSLIRKSSSSSAAITAPPPEAAISSNAGARGNAAAASVSPVSLRDPEAVQHLVRPIGPYASHVLGPLLTLLRVPVAEEGVQSMCDALAAHHAVHERAIAAASMSKATTAELQPRSSSTGPRNKESLLATEENGSAEAKSRRPVRGAASALLPDGGASASLLSVSAAAGPQTRSSVKTGQMLPQQRPRQWVATQLTLTAVLTALLFSPAFVRSRVAYLEEKLTRATSATAAASVIATADHAGQKGGGTAATLPLLFHRVQAVKMHAAHIEAVLAAAGPSVTTSEALRLLDPTQVLAAYTGRR